MAHTAAAVAWMRVSEVSGMHPSQDILNRASLLILVFPAL